MSIFAALMVCFFASSPLVKITWGTNDSILKFSQNFYSWIKIENVGDDAVDLNNKISYLDFFLIRENGEKIQIGRSMLHSSRPFGLRKGNSFFQYFGCPIGRINVAYDKSEKAILLAHSPSGQLVEDSARWITLAPQENLQLVRWFDSFDSLRSSAWDSFTKLKKSQICHIADSMLISGKKQGRKEDLINISAAIEYGKYCGNRNSICNGIPNNGWAHISALSLCAQNNCADVTNQKCNKSYELQDELTSKLLGLVKEISSDISGYHRFLTSTDTAYVPEIFYKAKEVKTR